ncbi:MAG: hypothetical protein L3K13_00160 [Thermoplasmata archaeon]|nr:hypothetical protein [Thermoplasmata archaeon]
MEDLAHLGLGSHCVSFHASRDEAKDQAVDFLAGAPDGQAASYWVGEPTLKDYYSEELARRSPDHVGCVFILPGPQVRWIEDRLRPADEVLEFVGAHPEGVSGAAETITQYWAPENVPDHLEYESWFQDQPRDHSRFLCPYDLRRIPPEIAPGTLRELGRHHTHVALSASREPAARLLQLFIFGSTEKIPVALRESLEWALKTGLVVDRGGPDGLTITPEGETIVREWNRPLGGA